MDTSVDVSIVKCSSYEPEEAERALDEVLAPIGGLSWVRPGMTVAVKANLVTMMKPESAATTHPVLLAALTKKLRALGAEVIVGDSPGGVYSAPYLHAVYNATGMKAVEQAGGRLNEDFSVADKDFPEGAAAKHIHYTAWLDQADAIIDFCKLKTHGMMGLSAAAKNMFGVIPGATKPEYHYQYADAMSFARMIVDLDRAFPIRLCLVDAVVGMEGNGPTAGKPRQVGCLLASREPHRLDMVCAKLIGLNPKLIPTLLAARELGLIPDTVEEVRLNQPLEPFCIPDYRNIKNIGHLLEQDTNKALWGRVGSAVLKALIASRPQVTAAECIGCGKCAQVCPAHAITIVKKKPQIDRKQCIRCFCCQEFCPKGAMKVHRPVTAKLIRKL